jgi:hypothetical protein
MLSTDLSTPIVDKLWVTDPYWNVWKCSTVLSL